MELKIPKKIVDYWTSYKNKFNPSSKKHYDPSSQILGNKLYWTIPEEVLWLYSTNNVEDYDGSQTQIGITRNGKIVWGFFSHCSCNGYENYEGDYEDYPEDTQKYYKLRDIDEAILLILKDRLKLISKIGLKDKKKAKK